LNLLDIEQVANKQKNLDSHGLNSNQYNKVRNVILEPSNFKTLIKGVSSKNQYVFISIHKILVMLGDLDQEDKISLFMETGASTSLVQQYVKN